MNTSGGGVVGDPITRREKNIAPDLQQLVFLQGLNCIINIRRQAHWNAILEFRLMIAEMSCLCICSKQLIRVSKQKKELPATDTQSFSNINAGLPASSSCSSLASL
jgi:hypothetical protein